MLKTDCNKRQICYYRDRSRKFPSVPSNEFYLRPQGVNQGQKFGNQAVGDYQMDEEPQALRRERAIAKSPQLNRFGRVIDGAGKD